MTETTAIRKAVADRLKVRIYETRTSMGAAAARDVADNIRKLLAGSNGFVNMIFAAAPSQTELLFFLAQEKGIDWSRVRGFHMDEYVGIDRQNPQSFGYYLREQIFDKVPFKQVHYIDGNAADLQAECESYSLLLQQNPVDIVCMGIGENTHIAFNDPHTAKFDDPSLVKVVALDVASRQQQVHDGCFRQLKEVPGSAITLTVPALMSAKSIYCIVPGKNKALAVFQTLQNEISENYPSTALKAHNNATLYLDNESAARLQRDQDI